jgi:hypothetical protein
MYSLCQAQFFAVMAPMMDTPSKLTYDATHIVAPKELAVYMSANEQKAWNLAQPIKQRSRATSRSLPTPLPLSL